MQTVFGDGSSKEEGLMDKLIGAGKKLLTGEGLFMTVFTNNGQGKQHVFCCTVSLKNYIYGLKQIRRQDYLSKRFIFYSGIKFNEKIIQN